jgi:hypothetical protein
MRKILFIILIILGFCTFLVNAGKLPESFPHAKSEHSFIAYKAFCCSPPFLNSDAGESFFVEGERTQPLPASVLDNIRKLTTVASAEPFLLFKIMTSDQLISICGFSGRNIETADNKAVLAKEYAKQNGLQIGDTIQVKDNYLILSEITDPDTMHVKADIYVSLSEAESIICDGTGLSSSLMNMIYIKSIDKDSYEKAVSEVKNIIGASVRIAGIGNNEERIVKANSCTCKKNAGGNE